jgi:uncharacterized NAD-dependent epimerase/dehydratase family protein
MKTILWVEGKLGIQSSKMASGVIRYGTKYDIVAVVDSTKVGQDVGDVLDGKKNGIPIVASIKDALAYNPKYFLVGLAPDTCVDRIDDEIRKVVIEAIDAHLNIVTGTLAAISDDRALDEYAKKMGVEIFDSRKPTSQSRAFSGDILKKRTKVLLTVGTDWSVGKMTTALEIVKETRKRGYKVAFVATGQTGILCGADVGIPADNIRTSYMTGAIEEAIMYLDNKGYDLIVVEGQGCITHPNGSGCPISLLYGSMPDFIVMCHDQNRSFRKLFPNFKINTIEQNLDTIRYIMFDYPVPRLVGISIISSTSNDPKLEQEIANFEAKYEVPVVDSRRVGVKRVVDSFINKLR